MTESTQRFFDARPGSVCQAREFATATLTDWGMLRRIDDIRLCVSELATNALVHGTAAGRGYLVKLDTDEDTVRLEVHDSCRLRPEVRQATERDPGGRGLMLVSTIADGWGVEDRSPLGKIVWSCFEAAGGAAE